MDLLVDLKDKNLITDEVIGLVTSRVEKGHEPLESALLAEGVPPGIVRSGFAEFFGVPVYLLSEGEQIEQQVLSYIQEDSARHYKVVPLKLEDGVLLVGVNDPEDLRVREMLNFISNKFGMPYKLVFMLEGDLKAAQKAYENLTGEVGDALTSLESDVQDAVDPEEAQSQKQQTY